MNSEPMVIKSKERILEDEWLAGIAEETKNLGESLAVRIQEVGSEAYKRQHGRERELSDEDVISLIEQCTEDYRVENAVREIVRDYIEEMELASNPLAIEAKCPNCYQQVRVLPIQDATPSIPGHVGHPPSESK